MAAAARGHDVRCDTSRFSTTAFPFPTRLPTRISTRALGQLTRPIMRQLKHHEKKLLKKVDFLNVSPVGALVHHTFARHILSGFPAVYFSEPA